MQALTLVALARAFSAALVDGAFKDEVDRRQVMSFPQSS
jgi:alkyl hydroperoxide reductase subunit AhpF